MRLCGYKSGDNQWSAHNGLTLEEIATQLGTSKANLKRALSIERNLTDSMKELLDTGVITKTLAADTISSLNGGNHGNQYKEAEPKVSDVPTQEQLAEMIGISVDTLSNYKKLTELVPELWDLIKVVQNL